MPFERARLLGRRLAVHVGPRRHGERDVDAGAVRRRRARRAPSSPPSPSRRPGRRSARSRGAPSARPRRRRCDRRPSRWSSACPRSRSRAGTGRSRGRRRRHRRRWATGSTSGSITLWNSTIEPGQPWVMSSGSAPGCGERTWTKWMSSPSIAVVNCVEAVEQRLALPPVVVRRPSSGRPPGSRPAARPGSSRRPARPPASACGAASISDRRGHRRQRRW